MNMIWSDQLREENKSLIERLKAGQKRVERSSLALQLSSVQQPYRSDRFQDANTNNSNANFPRNINDCVIRPTEPSLSTDTVTISARDESCPRVLLQDGVKQDQQDARRQLVSEKTKQHISLSQSSDAEQLAYPLSETDSPRTPYGTPPLSPAKRSTLSPGILRTDCDVTTPQRSRMISIKTPEKSSRKGTPHRVIVGQRYPETPKSILKHRRLIDANVHVKSKFQHTPGWMDRAKRANVGRTKPVWSGKAFKPRDSHEKIKVEPITRRIPSASVRFAGSRIDDSQAHDESTDAFEKQFKSINLQSDEGNVRIPSPNADRGLDSSYIAPLVGQRAMAPSLSPLKRQQFMGYDWIAALLENSNPSAEQKSESFFQELKEFRRIHRDECLNDAVTTTVESLDSSGFAQPSVAPPAEPTSPNHTCIHTYTVNGRLYTVPVYQDKHGHSRCSVCNKKKKAPSSASPAFVRISIPRSTLVSPYRVKPHRRKSFDPSDSAALSRHCLAGYVQPRGPRVPLGRNVDLQNETNRLKSKYIMTMKEAQDLARQTKDIPLRSRALDKTTQYNREARRITDQLLDLSQAIEFQKQMMNKTPVR